MLPHLLIYGSTGFVGREIARLAVERGLQPILGGRNAEAVRAQAAELGVESRIADLNDVAALEKALDSVSVVLHCAGPYLHTSKPMVDACLRRGVHYLDISGEIPVLQSLAEHDAEAQARGIMILPAVGFDVVPTDCLALYLKQRLPSATTLELAFQSRGPGGFPPGTQKTAIELLVHEQVVRRNGKLVPFPDSVQTRQIDFGAGPKKAVLFPWADVFTAYYTTQIPNISVFAYTPSELRKQMSLLARVRPYARFAPVRALMKTQVRPGPTPEQRAQTLTHVWGRVHDDQGKNAEARLHGPEPGVVWTSYAAVAAAQHVLAGDLKPGFQTPASAFGAEFVFECPGVTREDVEPVP